MTTGMRFSGPDRAAMQDFEARSTRELEVQQNQDGSGLSSRLAHLPPPDSRRRCRHREEDLQRVAELGFRTRAESARRRWDCLRRARSSSPAVMRPPLAATPTETAAQAFCDSNPTLPPCRSTPLRTIARPIPVLETAPRRAVVRTPGRALLMLRGDADAVILHRYPAPSSLPPALHGRSAARRRT